KKPPKPKPTWDQVMAKSKKPPRPYGISDHFKELEVISHPKFGIGYVTELIGDDKIEVTFQADKRVLVHNRKGLQLPFSMLRPLTPPTPKGTKGKKPRGKKATDSSGGKAATKANGSDRLAKTAGRGGKAAAKPKLPSRQVKQKARPQAARARSNPHKAAARG